MIQVPLKAGHQRPANKTPFKLRFAGVQMMAQHGILGSFVIFQGLVLLRNSIFL